MITVEKIRKQIQNRVYSDAVEILKKNQIRRINYSFEDYPEVLVSGTVIGDYRNIDQFEIKANAETGDLISFYCSCYNARRGILCPHAVAGILIFANGVEEGLIKVEKPSVPTSHIIKDLLSSILYENSDINADHSHSYILEPVVELEKCISNHAFQLSFKCGKKHGKMYVVKSIHELLKSIQQHTEYTFGTKSKVIFSKESFDQKSLDLIEMLMELDQSQDQVTQKMDYWNRYMDNVVQPALGKELSLKGSYIERFLREYKQEYYSCKEMKNSDWVHSTISFSDEPMKLDSTIETKDDGYGFSIKRIGYMVGGRYLYLFEEEKGMFHRMEFSQNLLTLLKYADDTYGKSYYINKNDMHSFTGKMYPTLSNDTNIHAHGFELSPYIPVKPEFKIYLDLPQDNLITGELYAVYGDKTYNVLDETKKNLDKDHRNMIEEEALSTFFAKYFNSFDAENKKWGCIDDEDKMYELLSEGIPAMHKRAEVYISDKLKRLQIKDVKKVQVGISVKHDLLQLSMQTDDIDMDSLAEIMSRYNPKKRYYRLKSGVFINVDDALEDLAELKDDLQLSTKDIRKGEVMLPKYRAMYLDNFADENKTFMIDRDTRFRQIIDQIHDTEERKHEIPEGLSDIMRDYQKTGFQWLCSLYENGFGGLLADEMGLGKTLQVIAFLTTVQGKGKSLIVCPASLVYNWNNEIRRFAPQLKALMLTGSAQIRKEMLEELDGFDVILTSYDILKRDIDNYENMHFICQVIDEAQYIKNANTQVSEAVKRINSTFHIALTGTPIENRLSELWSIFDYLMPGFLYKYTFFKREYESPIVKGEDEEQRIKLRKMIAPFILRRLKKDVLQDLPDKLEEIYYAPLEGEQKELYEARVKALRVSVASQSADQFNQSKLRILAELTRLRQICCSPSLVYENYHGNSEKEDMCVDLIKSAIEEGHKILLFSQFTTMLDQLVERLKEEKINYHLLVGSTPKKKRAEMVEAFQNDDVPVFCISMKAGGTGLNLTAADIVIHYDPWWNTAVENQATDRAHRIGQENVVTVYRLITKDTVEERIIQLQQQKADLADQILSGEEMSSSSFTKEELMSILQ